MEDENYNELGNGSNDTFLEVQIDHFSSIANDMESPESDVDVLDDLFREILRVAWEPI